MSDPAETAAPQQCAVCYEDTAAEDLAVLPCCHVDGSTTRFCKRCVTIICRERGLHGELGRCPNCSAWLRMKPDSSVEVATSAESGQCVCCFQLHLLVDRQRRLCEACLFGQSFRFRYRCARCSGTQVIPHPMWRYQPSPTEPGGVTWACHVGCDDYTTWSILPQEVALIPPEHCPESWGRRDEWLAQVRSASQAGETGGSGYPCTVM